MPREGATTFRDLIRGEIAWENRLLDDFIILKSDGYPTYHFAHAVDDHAMAITHVTRGDEWISSTPRHIRLFAALGWEPPAYVHTPVILGPDGSKLSKRHGAQPVLAYAAEGCLPEALLNLLAITGWAPDGETQVMTRGRARRRLRPRRPQPRARRLRPRQAGVAERRPHARAAGGGPRRALRRTPRGRPARLRAAPDRPQPGRALHPLIRERVKSLAEVAGLTGFFFAGDPPPAPPEDFLGRGWRAAPERAAPALAAAASALAPLRGEWRAEGLEAALRALAGELGVRAGDLFTLCRVAVTGARVAPPLFETMEIVGADACLARIAAAEAALRAARP